MVHKKYSNYSKTFSAYLLTFDSWSSKIVLFLSSLYYTLKKVLHKEETLYLFIKYALRIARGVSVHLSQFLILFSLVISDNCCKLFLIRLFLMFPLNIQHIQLRLRRYCVRLKLISFHKDHKYLMPSEV